MVRATILLIKILLLISAVLSQSSEYDFIIIGAGTAGCTLANRLSENENWKILLLEAGDEPTERSLIDTPFLAPALSLTDLNWGYTSEKQSNVGLGLVNGTVSLHRGKGVGGSSLINFMIHTRGNKYDYDRWLLKGNPGWSFNDVLPYFKKMESSLIENSDYEYRGTDGPVYSSYVPFQTESLKYFLKAAKNRGYSYVDYNGESQIGVSRIQTTTKDGKRWSAETAYIKPVRHVRKNLIVSTKSRVLKILIDPISKKAYGVDYLKNFRTGTATVRKEVILSAGAYNSPQILMLSGVGPSNDLNYFNIPVIKDSPVGRKLYDHVAFLGLFFETSQYRSVITTLDILKPSTSLKYIFKHKGLLSLVAGIEAVVFFNSNVTQETLRPDAELLYAANSMQVDAGLIARRSFNVDPQIYKSVWGRQIGKPLFQVLPVLLHPKSKGKVLLNTDNPLDAPRIVGNYLTDADQTDKKVLLKAIRETQRIISSSAYNGFGANIVRYELPGCDSFAFDSDEFWYCAMEYLSISLYHPSTTCKMGPVIDKEAVVDSKLKVHGIKRLRVIDASIIPSTVSGHLNVPTFMIAEKGADLIKSQWDEE